MPQILEWMRSKRAEYKAKDGCVLEVGSCNVNGSVRSVFTDATFYLGLDLAAGVDVDWTLDACQLDAIVQRPTFDTAVCCETLEHTTQFWRIVTGLKKALKPGGFLWVSTPTYGFPLHRFPLDCYRFGVDAYERVIMESLEHLAIETVADALKQPAIVALGRKPQA
jgi:hypothetical protein